MALAPGTRLGPYEVIALIGAGGMGEVYRARDTKLNRDVALKILPETFSACGRSLAKFRSPREPVWFGFARENTDRVSRESAGVRPNRRRTPWSAQSVSACVEAAMHRHS